MERNPEELRESVRKAYSRAASHPGEGHSFPMGNAFALSLGYPREILDKMPGISVESFTGASNVSLFAELSPGDKVADLGCGAGLDSMIAAQRVGAAGRIAGIDFSEAMLTRANSARRELGCGNILFLRSAAEHLPLADADMDHALVNGLFNLNPFRSQIFSELARILRPGGILSGAELILQAPLAESSRGGAANWFS
jgi:arsenite methyltransferase